MKSRSTVKKPAAARHERHGPEIDRTSCSRFLANQLRALLSAATMLNWFWSYLTFGGGIRLITGTAPALPEDQRSSSNAA